MFEGPTKEKERLFSLDVLRGFAVLGILVMNIQSFSMIGTAYFNPTSYGNFEGVNYWVWFLGHILTDQKFMTIFSMLFGAGILLMSQRAESAGRQAAPVHYRRMGWLILFGLMHAHLLWFGDILFYYGVCGLLAFRLRNLSPQVLLVIGLLTVGVASGLMSLAGLSAQFWPEEQRVEFLEESWRPNPEQVEHELAVYRGGWIQQMSLRVPSAVGFETFIFLMWGFWRAGGLMLVGMALFKWRWFDATRSDRLYGALIAVAAFLGVPIVLYGVQRIQASGWDAYYSFFFGLGFNYWGSIVVSLGWIGLIMLFCKKDVLAPLTRSLAAVGRMALTNYLLQTLLCTTLFYGHGLGMFGKLERIEQLGVVIAVWVVQILVSPLWMKYFHFGPFEWLWRSLTYWKPQPFRRAIIAS